MGIIIKVLDEFYEDYGLIMDFKITTVRLSHRKNEKCGLKKMSK
jgi:hypothetical protein